MQEYKNPRLLVNSTSLEPGKVSWRSPSNIAIIKYWGKYGRQLPKNPSLSFTLDKAYTETTVIYKVKEGADQGIALDFYFDGKKNEGFRTRLVTFLSSVTDVFPFIKQLDFEIHSTNSFPHSSGIASSASAMSALALCLCSMEDRFFGTLGNVQAFRQKASYVARLASGSAARSVFADAAIWGESSDAAGSSNLFAIPADDLLHAEFKNFHDSILIISTGEKAVSSSAGHALMDGNRYSDSRYAEARQRFSALTHILRKGDLTQFGLIAEAEAMSLHALMMMSMPPFILMQPGTLSVIQKIHQYRKETKQPLYFTLDAGPNVHVLYPDAIKDEVTIFIKEQLLPFCENGRWIDDMMGAGPLEM